MAGKPLHSLMSYLHQLESTLADDAWTDAFPKKFPRESKSWAPSEV